MEISQVIVQLLDDYPALISFLASFIFSKETIILLGISVSQGLLNFWILVVFSLLGFVVGDSIWFFLGRLKFLSFLKKYRMMYKGYRKAGKIIDKVSNKSATLTLIIVKSFYGASIFTFMYMGRKRDIKYKSFFIADLISSGLLVLIAAGVGWFAGRGFTM